MGTLFFIKISLKTKQKLKIRKRKEKRKLYIHKRFNDVFIVFWAGQLEDQMDFNGVSVNSRDRSRKWTSNWHLLSVNEFKISFSFYRSIYGKFENLVWNILIKTHNLPEEYYHFEIIQTILIFLFSCIDC